MPDEEFIFNQIETIFSELAQENLDDDFFSLLDSQDIQLVCEMDEVISDSWEDLLYEVPSDLEYVQVSMKIEMGENSRQVALFLLSLDFEYEKECHIQWLW